MENLICLFLNKYAQLNSPKEIKGIIEFPKGRVITKYIVVINQIKILLK
ncbi:MAG TPA: hypothetical protein GX708_10515 [Gallicola sp.]|nr:hypothetical protein [Gallicola sp.]